MDPVSHAIAGRAVTAMFDDGKRWGPGVGVAAIVGALSPDVDIALAPAGWDIYLRAHEVGTHSVLGALAVAACVAALVHRVRPGSRYAPLAAAASAGAISHLALDALSGARLLPAWPFASANVSLPLVAMADPWLLAIFVAGAIVMWSVPHRRSAARLVVGVVVAFLCVKGALLDRALRSANLEPASPRTVDAYWGSFAEWWVCDRTPRMLRKRLVDGRGKPPRHFLSWPIDEESPLVTASRSLDTVRNFLHGHALVFATEEPDGAGRTAVFWSDLRYCWPSDKPMQIVCTQWFGGIFGPDGRALIQQVKVGEWVRSRPPP